MDCFDLPNNKYGNLYRKKEEIILLDFYSNLTPPQVNLSDGVSETGTESYQKLYDDFQDKILDFVANRNFSSSVVEPVIQMFGDLDEAKIQMTKWINKNMTYDHMPQLLNRLTLRYKDSKICFSFYVAYIYGDGKILPQLKFTVNQGTQYNIDIPLLQCMEILPYCEYFLGLDYKELGEQLFNLKLHYKAMEKEQNIQINTFMAFVKKFCEDKGLDYSFIRVANGVETYIKLKKRKCLVFKFKGGDLVKQKGEIERLINDATMFVDDHPIKSVIKNYGSSINWVKVKGAKEGK